MGIVKDRIKTILKNTESAVKNSVKKLFPVTKDGLESALRKVGLKESDTVFVHSSYSSISSFDGTPLDAINVILKIIGKEGNLLMPTFPMEGLTKVYLDADPVFDADRTPSRTGVLTEIFRRMDGVRRSTHPSHSIAALGPKAGWFTDGQHKNPDPFGNETPFAKLCESGGKVLLLGVGLRPVTLVHRAEDILRSELPAPLYLEQPYEARVIVDGNKEMALTYVHNPALSRRRDIYLLYPDLKNSGILSEARLGLFYPLSVTLFNAGVFVEKIVELFRSGKTFFKKDK